MRAALLARVSSTRQANEDRHSLPVQTQQMHEFAARMGWEVVRVFEIPGESAFTDDLAKRPQFAEAIDAACRNEFEALIVYDVTRFARNQYLFHASTKRLREAGVGLWGINGVNYVEEPLRAGVEAAFAEQQSRDQSLKIRDAKARRHARGLPTGDIPFGYVSRGTDVPPEPVEPEAEAVRWAFRERARGAGYAAIADEFNSRGLKPRSKRGYTGFTVSSIQSLLENDFYCGYVTHRGSRAQGLHEPIISEELWESAQAVAKKATRKNKSSALLVGIAKCAQCGGPIWTTVTGKRPATSYREPSRQQLRECPNAGKLWRAHYPDARVDILMRNLCCNEAWLKAAEEEASEASGASGPAREQLEGKRDRATKAFIAGALPEEEWLRIKEEIDAELARLPEPGVDRTLELRNFGELWDLMTVEEKRQAIRAVFDRVLLDTAGKDVFVAPRPQYEALFRVGAGVPPAGIEPYPAPTPLYRIVRC